MIVGLTSALHRASAKLGISKVGINEMPGFCLFLSLLLRKSKCRVTQSLLIVGYHLGGICLLEGANPRMPLSSYYSRA